MKNDDDHDADDDADDDDDDDGADNPGTCIGILSTPHL